MTMVPFLHAAAVGDRFIALLERHNIHPPIKSKLERELLSLTHLLSVTKDPNRAPTRSQPETMRAAAGIHDLAAKVLSVETISEFDQFVPHLRLIGEGKIPAASIAQNAASAQSDDTSRKFAELYLGCLVAHIGTNVRLDSPTNAKGDNPDIIFTLEPLEQPAKDWAIAIKTISSKSGQTIFERIAEAAAQIDSDKCKADVGIVVINTKSALDHDALWNTCFPTLEDAAEALRSQVVALTAAVDHNRPADEWRAVFSGRVVSPVLFLAQTVVLLHTAAGTNTPTALKMLICHDPCPMDPVAHGLAKHMNELMQRILLGMPGAQGQLPT